MVITGRIAKEPGIWWSAEAPVAGVYTQGKSRKDAERMLADALESLINRPGFKVTITSGGEAGSVFVEANEPAALAAYVLKHQREAHDLSLADVAKLLGVSSRTNYARYEQGKSVPTLDKFVELLHAIAPEMAVVVGPRRLTEAPRRSLDRVRPPGYRSRTMRYSSRRSGSRPTSVSNWLASVDEDEEAGTPEEIEAAWDDEIRVLAVAATKRRRLLARPWLAA
jgi:transcriptional regulator with XRE-family HTH domain